MRQAPAPQEAMPCSSLSRPLRILLLVEGFNSLGGIPEIVDNLAAELIALGQDVVVASTRDTQAAREGRERGTRTGEHCKFMRIRKRKPARPWRPDRVLSEPLRVLRSPFARLVADWRPDVINSHLYMWDRYPNVTMIARRSGVALIQSFHSFDIGRGVLGIRGLHAIAGARAFTALSEATRRFIGELLPAASSATVITGGVDPDAAEASPAFAHPRPYILCACRLDLVQKAVDSLIEAFAMVAPSHPVDLLIAGGGPDRDRLKRQSAELGLSDRIFFLGARRQPELRALYKGATLFAQPSRREEALGLVFLEAMAAGIPVVATRLGGVPEIVKEGETGLLAAEGAPSELAAALERLLANPEERRRMGRTARQWAAQFSWRRFAEQYLALYRTCLKQG